MHSKLLALSVSVLLPVASAHIAMWHPSMWGFNATTTTPFPGDGVPGITDNRPVVPLMNRTFEQWWFHGYLEYPPHEDDIMQLPAGGSQNIELACNRVYTSYWELDASDQPENPTNSPCPGTDQSAIHANNINDLGGCALAIAYESDATQVQPEDFTVFSVNQTCVWEKDTVFQVPADMPPCPNGKCTCAWFWIHDADAGSEQNYMISFQCNIENATGTVPVAKGNPARRCGDDPQLGREANPANCTVGARTPSYWFQAEQNNQFEDGMNPPLYTPLYGWADGAQTDIFRSVAFGTDPNATTPVPPTTSSLSPSPSPTSASSSPIPTAATSTSSSPIPTNSNTSPTVPSPAMLSSGYCLRPVEQQSALSRRMDAFADMLGLGNLRQRRSNKGVLKPKAVSS